MTKSKPPRREKPVKAQDVALIQAARKAANILFNISQYTASLSDRDKLVCKQVQLELDAAILAVRRRSP